MNELHNDLATSYDRENRGIPRLFARHIIPLVPIASSSIIHDNACGPAVVTSELMSSLRGNHPAPRIIATDVSPPMISASEELIAKNKWTNVAAKVMDSNSLSFPEGTFTHSFTNFIVPTPPGVAGEIYRVLKPGGTAVFTTWKFHGFVDVMRRACLVTRPGIEPAGILAAKWMTEDALRKVFTEAGFQEIDIKAHREDLKFDNSQDMMDMVSGPFGKFVTKDWTEQEVEKLPRVIPQVLTPEESSSEAVEMSGWIVIAKKH